MTPQEQIAAVKADIPAGVIARNARWLLWTVSGLNRGEPCPACDGSFRVMPPRCLLCHGEGRVIGMLATAFVRVWAVKFEPRQHKTYRKSSSVLQQRPKPFPGAGKMATARLAFTLTQRSDDDEI